MHTPGESLRQEREARGKTIEEMAEATGILPHLLTALENEAFDDLPGRGFGKLYIRAYAEVLGFDPRPVIEAYDQAVRDREPVTEEPAPATASNGINAGFARWRQERLAGRARFALDEAAEGELEPDEVEPEIPPEFRDMPEDRAAPEVRAAPGFEEAPHRREEVPSGPRPAAPAWEFMQAAPPLAGQEPSPSRFVPARRWLVPSLLLLVLLPLTAYFVFLRSTPDNPPVATRPEPVPRRAVAPPPSHPSSPQADPVPGTAPPEADRVPRTPPPQAAPVPRTPAPRTPAPARGETAAPSLEVAESGVGRRVVGGRLEGEGDRFRAGQRATFATRVLGGRAGDRIDHVWLRDGKVEQSISLRVGGASWRTHSTKTLGRAGDWSVEARDEQGRVLARSDFSVAP